MDVAQINDAWTAYVNDWRTRHVRMRADEGIQFMDDHELDQSIIADILTVSVWEYTYKQKVSFTKEHLITFVYSPQRKRVLNHLIGLGMVHNDGGELRIKQEHWTIAQDFCGVFYDITPITLVDSPAKVTFEEDFEVLVPAMIEAWTNTQKAMMPTEERCRQVGNVQYVKFGG